MMPGAVPGPDAWAGIVAGFQSDYEAGRRANDWERRGLLGLLLAEYIRQRAGLHTGKPCDHDAAMANVRALQTRIERVMW